MIKVKTKKGQLEIIGLVVIVILISLGMLFYLRFRDSGDITSQKQDFVQKELTISTLNSLLQTRTNCLNYEIKDLIKSFVEQETIPCTPSNPEDFLVQIINNTLLKNTLYKWGKEYRLTISTTLNIDEFEDTESGDVARSVLLRNKIKSPNFDYQCSIKRKDSSLFFLSRDTGKGKIYITLEVCSSY